MQTQANYTIAAGYSFTFVLLNKSTHAKWNYEEEFFKTYRTTKSKPPGNYTLSALLKIIKVVRSFPL
jgi:hypothetical protein